MTAFFTDNRSAKSYRDQTTIGGRTIEFSHRIDPGFINRRLVNTIVGHGCVSVINKAIADLPPLPGGLHEAQIDRVYEEAVRYFCQSLKVRTLGDVLASRKGKLFCSIEEFAPCPDVYDKPHASSVILPAGNAEDRVVIEYSTRHVRSDTLRMHLDKGTFLAVVAILDRFENDTLYCRPLVIGWPWVSHPDEQLAEKALWVRYQLNENYIDDFDEWRSPISIATSRRVLFEENFGWSAEAEAGAWAVV